ncbi:monocarboxylate transporter 12-B-like [Patiria miniata]|uniref:Major facilitator superfamily (MFS) profile domain-containing protein n=1 Tax=Patiria miniata TaxID=46514 RepID=A0A913ZKR9_PATMI|nr:monocarboxylate transporter 12-B-like [Patiria miniata]
MEYFPDDFAFANGASLAGGTTGMMVLPPVMEYLVSVYGWRRALGLMGAFSFNYVVCGALLRPRNKSSLPAQYSLVPSRSIVENASPKSGGLADGRDQDEEGNSAKFNFGQIVKYVRERFDAHILAEPLFVIISVVSTLEGMLFGMWHLYLIPQGVELGFGDSPSAFLATFGGAGSLLGRISHGFPIDRGHIKATSLFTISCLIFAASNMLDPLVVTSYIAIAAVAFVSGVAFGVIYPLMFVLMRDVTGDRHMSAYGWLFVTHGIGMLLGGALAGWIHDLTGEYQWVFVSLGVIAATMATLVTSMRLMVHCSGAN